MSDDASKPSPDQPPPHSGAYSEQFQHTPVGARLPDKVAHGEFSTGVIVMEGPEEFVLDFVQGLSRPPRVASRIVLTPNVMAQFVAALKDNLQKYEQAFGAPKAMPTPNVDRRPSMQEIYQDLRLPDEMLSGVYANTVMIGHSPSEFFMDFITRFYPNAAVSSRIYLAASQVPQALNALTTSFQNRLNRIAEQKKKHPDES